MKQLYYAATRVGILKRGKFLVRAYLRDANSHRDARRWDLAIQQYRHVLKLSPELADIWVQLGHALKESGQVAASLQSYHRSISLDASKADTYLHLGHAYKLQGRLADAKVSYTKALTLDPGLTHAADELSRLPPADAATSVFSQDIEQLSPPGRIRRMDKARDEWVQDDQFAMAGLLPNFVQRFDPEYYARERGIEAEFSRVGLQACLADFFENGLAQCVSISERLWFDPAFYRQTYGNSFPMTDPDLYRHWLNVGIAQGQAPNQIVWLQDAAGIDLRSFDDVDLAYIRAAVPEWAYSSDTDVLSWLIEGGLLDSRLIGLAGDKAVDFFHAAAVRASSLGNTKLALALAEAALVRNPRFAPALHLHADRLVDAGHTFSATSEYRSIIDAGQAAYWTHTHLMACLNKQARYREAYNAIADGVRAFPDYVTNRYNLKDAMELYFNDSVKRYNVLAAAGHVHAGQKLIEEFCQAVTSLEHLKRLPPRPIRSVALFALMDLPQCKSYRIDQKVDQLEAGGFDVEVFDANSDLVPFLAEIRKFDAVIFYRLPPLSAVVVAIRAAYSLGLIIFYEIDDLIFLTKEYPGTLESYGGQISRETFNMLAMGVPMFLSVMKMCDYAIASTPSLAREMAPFVLSGKAFVHRNGLGSDHSRYLDYTPPLPETGQPVTIFYGSGTRAHKEDFQQLIEPALIEIARRHGRQVAFVMVGWLPISDELRAASSSLTVIEPIFDLHQYWSLLQQADINLAVLKPSLSVDCKSEIKWMEAGLFGVPSVVSRTATYAEVIQEGKTGFLCDTIDEWVTTLDRLIRDPALRKAVGLAAQAVVRRDYRIEVLSENLRSIMRAVSPAPNRPRQKVLVVNVFYTPQTYGGATRVVHDNIMHLHQHYSDLFELEVFACIDGAREDYVIESYQQDGIAVTGVTRSVAGETTSELIDSAIETIFRRHLITTKPDLIHFHCIQRLSIGVVNAAKDLKIPYVITAHDAWWVSDHQFLIDDHGREQTYNYSSPKQVLIEHGQKSFARLQCLRPALMGARAVLGVSEPFSEVYRRSGVPNVRTVANGVSALPLSPRRPSPDGRVRLGHIGGMSRHKGFFLLKHVLQKNKFEHLYLIVVDHSKFKGHKHQEIWGTTPVTIIGKFGQDEVGTLYAEIDVLLAPSLWSESFGLVTREAHMSGCWIVASDLGAIGTDVREDVDGHVIDVSDSRGLTKALMQIDQHPQRYMQPPPGRALRTAAEQGDELASIYKEILDM